MNRAWRLTKEVMDAALEAGANCKEANNINWNCHFDYFGPLLHMAGYVSVRSPKEMHAYLSAFLEINSSSQIEKIITIHMTTTENENDDK